MGSHEALRTDAAFAERPNKFPVQVPGSEATAWIPAAAGFQLPRLSLVGANPALFVIAFDMRLNVVYQRKSQLSTL